ncbi:hypothetical protein Tco_0203005 [Tanacetum coccineum]
MPSPPRLVADPPPTAPPMPVDNGGGRGGSAGRSWKRRLRGWSGWRGEIAGKISPKKSPEKMEARWKNPPEKFSGGGRRKLERRGRGD